jgi:membrane-bound ClpP family serine protease
MKFMKNEIKIGLFGAAAGIFWFLGVVFILAALFTPYEVDGTGVYLTGFVAIIVGCIFFFSGTSKFKLTESEKKKQYEKWHK